MTKAGKAAAAALALVLSTAGPSHADSSATILIQQVGNDVVVTGSGAFNLDGLTHVNLGEALGGGIGAQLDPSFAVVVVGANNSLDGVTGLSGPSSFGPGAGTSPTTASGDIVGYTGTYLVLPGDYTSGTFVSGSATYDNATFASLGLTPGTYTYTWGDPNTLTVQVGSTVPEPSTWAMTALGFTCLAYAGVRRSRKQTAATV